MTEMNRFSRFFVNRSARRRSARELRWLRGAVPLPEGLTCLELGCGAGQMALLFQEAYRPARYVATDLDPDQLAEAQRTWQRRFPGGVPPPLELRRADMLALDFPAGSFDAVLAFVTIHHASASHHDYSRIPVVLDGIDRVLRPGGFVIYAEMLHQERIRAWFAEHGYRLRAVRPKFHLEYVVVQKPPPA
ncbi:MAG TPA: class I SAM-dependent methyltransferase [Thermoplasmata archaeon]|nr:class I SAM-dependent methyltransferase [Thermoplasmata archaeon]